MIDINKKQNEVSNEIDELKKKINTDEARDGLNQDYQDQLNALQQQL